MPDLTFHVESAAPLPYAAAPQLALKIHLTNSDSTEAIHTVALRCQIQIEAAGRRYSASEQESLRDLFGTAERWGQTLKTMLWTHASTVVPAFRGSTSVDLAVPCTFDFNVAATKYFHGLSDGDIPICLQFSGTIFYPGTDGTLQVAPIPWDREARFRLPAQVWRDLMNVYYPNCAWLCLRRDVFERLYQRKTARGIPTWEEVIESVLQDEEVIAK